MMKQHHMNRTFIILLFVLTNFVRPNPIDPINWYWIVSFTTAKTKLNRTEQHLKKSTQKIGL